MDDADVSRDCSAECLPDCEETAYDLQIDTTNLDAEELCKNKPMRTMALGLWNSTGNVLTWMFQQSRAMSNVMISDMYADQDFRVESGLALKICNTMMKKNMARVILEVAKPNVMGVEKQKKATFPDQLGTVGKVKLFRMRKAPSAIFLLIGGTIGLFTGLSLISVIEAIYWLYLTAFQFLKGKMSTKDAKKRGRSAVKSAASIEGWGRKE